MTFIELPILDLIDTFEEEIDVYITNKDRKVIAVKDIQSNPVFDGSGVYIDHISLGSRHTFVMLHNDFLHLDYRVRSKKSGNENQKEFSHISRRTNNISDEDYLEGFERYMDN